MAWRGSPIRVGFDVQALAENGHAVDLLTLPLGTARATPGVRVIRVARLPGVRDIPIGPSFAKLAFDVLLLAWALGLALRRGYDVVHGVEEAGAIGWLVARLAGARLVFERHSDPVSHRAGGLRNLVLRAYAAVERFVARRADAVIGTGPGLVEQVRAAAPGRPAYLIPDIPSSLADATPAGAAAARGRLGARADDVLVLYIGSFAVYQGIDLLFAAIPRVLATRPSVRFAVIGGAPEEIERRRRELGAAAAAVTFAGHVPPDEVPDCLAAADILLSPRRSGANTPLKVLDYFKAGRAIVATDVPANRLLLDEAVAVITPPEPEAYAAGIVALAGDPARRTALGERGRERQRSLHSYAEFRRRLAACYDALPPRRGGRAER